MHVLAIKLVDCRAAQSTVNHEGEQATALNIVVHHPPAAAAGRILLFPSRFARRLFIWRCAKKDIPRFISTPTPSGASSGKVAASARPGAGAHSPASIGSSVLQAPPLLVLSHHGSLIYHEPHKEGLDRVRSDQHHSINPCDYPRLQGVWAMCLPVRVPSARTFVSDFGNGRSGRHANAKEVRARRLAKRHQF